MTEVTASAGAPALPGFVAALMPPQSESEGKGLSTQN